MDFLPIYLVREVGKLIFSEDINDDNDFDDGILTPAFQVN